MFLLEILSFLIKTAVIVAILYCLQVVILLFICTINFTKKIIILIFINKICDNGGQNPFQCIAKKGG